MDGNTKTQSPVTAAEVHEVRFPLVRRGGYDPKQVDPFLEIIATRLSTNAEIDQSVDAKYVHDTRFVTVRRGGYAPASVDAFLDRVIDTLDPPAAQQPDSALPAPPEEPDQTTAPLSVSPGDTNAVWTPQVPTELALEEGRANLERLRVLYDAGLLSDKELAVLARRVKRRAREQHQQAGNVA